MQTIKTESLTLEPQIAAHAEEMFIVLSDPAIYEFENAPPASLEWLRNRFVRLESRGSADGSQTWLNWVVRLPSSELIGYVQATVYLPIDATRRSDIAYEFHSAYWGQGFARSAVDAMIVTLVSDYGVTELTAILKAANFRSKKFLDRLGFRLASDERAAALEIESDEILMARDAVF